MPPNYLVIGLSGVTCGGKSTLAAKLAAHFPPGVVTILLQDRYFWADKGRMDYLTTIGHHDYEQVKCVDFDRYLGDALKVIDRFTRNPHLSARDQILILDGFLLFNEPRLLALCTLKYHFSLPYNVAKSRREARFYLHPDKPGYFDQAVWPAYLKHSAEIAALRTEGIVTLDGTEEVEKIFRSVLKDVENLLTDADG